MKTTISGLIAAVMALSVFATAGFAFVMPSSMSVASYLDADGFTTYSTASAMSETKYTAETWNNIGSITSYQSANANTGFMWIPGGMQTSENTFVSGFSTVAQETVWNFADANIYNGLITPAGTNEQRVDNWGSGMYKYSADIVGTGAFFSSVGINKPTNCDPVFPKTPVLPVCGPGGCQPQD